MTLILPLRREAEMEAARLATARATASRGGCPSCGDIPATILRRSAVAGRDAARVVFFVRSRIADSSGRLLEDVVLAVGAPLPRTRCGRKRRAARLYAQRLLDQFEPGVRAVIRRHVANRMADLALQHGPGIERTLEREQRLIDILRGNADALVQPGLFDRRVLHAAVDRDVPLPNRRNLHLEALDAEIVLLLYAPWS